MRSRIREDGKPCKPGCMRKPGHAGACPVNPNYDPVEGIAPGSVADVPVEWVCGACGAVRGPFPNVEAAQEDAGAHAMGVHADRIKTGPGFQMETREAFA